MRILDLVLPPACVGCGSTAGPFCAACRRGLCPPSAPLDRFVAPDPAVVLGDALLLALAAFAYEGPMRRALAALKYGGASRVASVLAALAAPALGDLLRVAGRGALVPVPLHRDRGRARGYNQAELIARQLAAEAALSVATPLARVRSTSRQHRLNRAARLDNLRGAFTTLARPPPVVILVDDIITTTATLEACASVLRAAGAEAVYGFAVAREV